MLGHASAAMTLGVYAGLFGDDLDAVADSLDAAARRSGADIVADIAGRGSGRAAPLEASKPGLIRADGWWGGRGLNPRPEDYESDPHGILWHLQAA
jgi:hypothetical protein